jgi:threonine aldolase
MRSSPNRGFASDNAAGIHPRLLDAILQANEGHALAYGEDPFTARALSAFERTFGEGTKAFLVFNGTAANVLALQCLVRPHEAVLCASHAHIQVDECGAPERFLGSKLIPIATGQDGKLTPELIERQLRGIGDQHRVQPRAISISQTTEVGTVYRPEEIRALSSLARSRGLLLHMDGARLSNAAAALGVALAEASLGCGVDALSFGGTKIGLLAGEAVVLRDGAGEAASELRFQRKQAMQLASKMRFVSAQFEALLSGELWKEIALHANAMAALLAEKARSVPGVRVSRPVEANAVFALLPSRSVEEARREHFFHVVAELPEQGLSEARWMTAFDTRPDEIEAFVARLRELLAAER